MHQTEDTLQRLATFHSFAAGLPGSEDEEASLLPVPEAMRLEGESDARALLNVLMDPTRTEKRVERLVQDGFLSQEIKEVESATIRMETDPKGPVCIISVGGKYGWNWDVIFLERGKRDWRRVGRIPLP